MDTLFYEYYHEPYPSNLNLLEGYLSNFDMDDPHIYAAMHFIDCLRNRENGFIYGMLCEAWRKYRNSL